GYHPHKGVLMRRLLLVLLVTLFITPVLHATCGGGGGGGTGGMMPRGPERGRPDAYLVPWKVIKVGEAPPAMPLVLVWFPASSDDTTAGELVSSRMLTIASTQCVGMQLVRSEDAATIARWDVAGKQPVALLVGEDKVLARVDNEKGLLRSSAVENM